MSEGMSYDEARRNWGFSIGGDAEPKCGARFPFMVIGGVDVLTVCCTKPEGHEETEHEYSLTWTAGDA